MLLGSYTNTTKGQPGGASQHYGPNGNVAMDQISVFGAISQRMKCLAHITKIVDMAAEMKYAVDVAGNDRFVACLDQFGEQLDFRDMGLIQTVSFQKTW